MNDMKSLEPDVFRGNWHMIRQLRFEEYLRLTNNSTRIENRMKMNLSKGDMIHFYSRQGVFTVTGIDRMKQIVFITTKKWKMLYDRGELKSAIITMPLSDIKCKAGSR